MQRKCLLALLGLLTLALAAAPALAGTLSFNTTHDFTVGVDTSNVGLSAQAVGSAAGTTVNPDNADGGFIQTTGSPATSTAAGFYVTNNQAGTSFSDPTIHMTQTMVANAPDAIFGFTSQETYNDALFTFTASSTGRFTTLVGDTYSQSHSLVNTGPWLYSTLLAYSNLQLTLTDTTTGAYYSPGPFNYRTYEVGDNSGLPLPDFADNAAGSPLYLLFLDGVTDGDTLTLEINLDSTQEGSSAAAVPLPPSILLLGSGLGGLFLARRWHRA